MAFSEIGTQDRFASGNLFCQLPSFTIFRSLEDTKKKSETKPAKHDVHFMHR